MRQSKYRNLGAQEAEKASVLRFILNKAREINPGQTPILPVPSSSLLAGN